MLDQFGFHHVLEETAGIALVVFTGPACGACRRLKQVLQSGDPALEGISLFEVDAQRDMALTREFEVFHLPSLFLFVDGEFHSAVSSAPSPAALRSAVDAALAQPPREAP